MYVTRLFLNRPQQGTSYNAKPERIELRGVHMKGCSFNIAMSSGAGFCIILKLQE